MVFELLVIFSKVLFANLITQSLVWKKQRVESIIKDANFFSIYQIKYKLLKTTESNTEQKKKLEMMRRENRFSFILFNIYLTIQTKTNEKKKFSG